MKNENEEPQPVDLAYGKSHHGALGWDAKQRRRERSKPSSFGANETYKRNNQVACMW